VQKLARRLVTIPGVFLGMAALIVGAPLWVPLLAAIDLVRGLRLASLRTALLLSWVLTCEAAGIAATGALWLWHALWHAGGGRARSRWDDRYWALEFAWAEALLGGAQAILSFRIEVEPGGEPPASGPVLLLMRHVSMADTLLPAWLFSRTHGIRLRYVLKRELLWDPCLDLVGHRLPNVFVDRSGHDSEAAVVSVEALARDLEPRDGVLIYPEGTRVTPEKQRRAARRLAERGEAELAAHAAALRHLLPPRPGGTLALLERFAEQGEGNVVVCGHTGFEGTTSLIDVWNGTLIGRVVRVRCWTTPVRELPADRRAWLLDAWRTLDAWLDEKTPQE